MKLTFNSNNYINSYNNHNKENSSIYSNNILFPSIFSHFETEIKNTSDPISRAKSKISKNKVYLPPYKNIKEEISTMKKEIYSLYNVKNSLFQKMHSKYNSIPYKNLVKGLMKYFFGPFGLVTKRNKFLREYYLHKSVLNDRIYAGKLAYYDYASHNTTKEIKMKNENTKRRLSLSLNLAVVFDKNDVSSMKALTTKKFYNYKKNFVDINRRIYYNSNKNKDEEKNELQLIRESPDNKKNNKKMTKKNLKINLNIYNTFNKIKNANKLKGKYFSFINNYTNNKEINKTTKSKSPKRHIINLKLANINKKTKSFFLTESNKKM